MSIPGAGVMSGVGSTGVGVRDTLWVDCGGGGAGRCFQARPVAVGGKIPRLRV